MKKHTYLLVILLAFIACKNETKVTSENLPKEQNKAEFSIVIHGGAGNIKREKMSPEKEAEYTKKLEEAIRVGYDILKNGGTSLDAVQKTINVLEDSILCTCD